MSDTFEDLPFAEMLDSVASVAPTPGAGPSLAWTCGLAAALVEMVTAVTLRKSPELAEVTEERHARAGALRHHALGLAGADAAAYQRVLAVQRQRDQPGHAQKFRQALADAADPITEIAEAARDVAQLAADALADARGGVRGEAVAAIGLSSAVTRACLPVVELNLAGQPDDPRRARVLDAARTADALLQQAAPMPGPAAH